MALLDSFAPFALFSCNRAEYRTRESHPQINTDAGVDGGIHDRLVVGEIEVGQETKGTQGEREDWGYDALK